MDRNPKSHCLRGEKKGFSTRERIEDRGGGEEILATKGKFAPHRGEMSKQPKGGENEKRRKSLGEKKKTPRRKG